MADYPFAPGPANGIKILVAAPTGLAAVDTPAVQAAITRLTAAGGNASMQFQDGTYQVDSNALIIQSCANFAILGTGAASIITQAPNRATAQNNTAGDLFIIADSTDFRVEGITFDGQRDTVAPLTPLTATANSGQPSVTVAAGQGARYQSGQSLNVYGGVGSADASKHDGGVIIASITPGGGSGGGDLITFTTNLANTYSSTGGTSLSDGFGPYAWTSDYLTPYQTGINFTVAGRTLYGEDQQNALHLMNCQRFTVTRCTARNIWESGIKMGTGFRVPATSSISDACSNGSVTDCTCYHGYDQGVSVWLSSTISVIGNTCNASGWGGVVLTGSDYCTVVGNKLLNSVYAVPGATSGQGVAVEGGRSNQVKGNIITGVNVDGIRVWTSPLSFGLTTATFPTTSAFLAGQTAAGTSIQVSSTTNLLTGAYYSIVDGKRTEAITVATIVDGTHITLSDALQFAHVSGCYITDRIPQDNVVEGNTIYAPVTGNGILNQTAVRTVIKDNSIRNWALGTGGSGYGIAMKASGGGPVTLPAGVYLGGNGSVISGNTIGGGLLQSIYADSTDSLTITGNRLHGPSQGSNAVMYLPGLTDSTISENLISPSGGAATFVQGVYGTTGTVIARNPARLTVTGNMVNQTGNEGILFILGDSLTITGNVVSSCGGNAGIDLRGITNSLVANNISNSNAAAGIALEVSGAVGCTNNRVIGNTCRDDGTGINIKTGAAQTQQNGIVESGAASNINLFLGNEVDANAVGQLTTVGAGSVTHYNIVSGAITA